MPLPIATRLSEAMRRLGVIVETKPELPNVAEFMRFLCDMAARDAADLAQETGCVTPRPPPLMAARDMTVEQIAAFADAAAALYSNRDYFSCVR
jgi:hypothetical protein